jgi:hypothetical protein
VLSSHSVHGLAEGWGCGLVVSDGRVKKFGLEFAKDGMDLRLNSYGCWWSGVYAAISLAVATEIDLRKFSPSASPPLLPPLLQRLSCHQVDRRAGNCPGDPVIIFVSLHTTSARKGISPNPPPFPLTPAHLPSHACIPPNSLFIIIIKPIIIIHLTILITTALWPSYL